MCLAKAFLKKNGEEPILQDISHIKLDGARVVMKTLFGEDKVISGRVLEIDFLSSKVILDSEVTTATEA